MTKKTLEECLKEFCWRGSSVFPFCPGCMIPILTEGDLWTIVKTIKKYHLTDLHHYPQLAQGALSNLILFVSKFLVGKPVALSYFISSNEEMANLMNHRWVIYPVCHDCVDKRSPEFIEKMERNLAFSRRFIKFRNVTEEIQEK